ncbi:hypothetical protein HDU76_013776 [Blyttiomyces sp. JEL0837]|nr:hypothetical protein HDU76_013776 [Blyttiomyces sp. JEL0837]
MENRIGRRSLQPAGGKSSISFGSDTPETPPPRRNANFRQEVPVSRMSNLSIFDDEPEVARKAHIKTLAPPGGRTSLSLSGDGEVKPYFERRAMQSPGGNSTINLGSDEVSTPIYGRRRSGQTAGGRSSIVFGDERIVVPAAKQEVLVSPVAVIIEKQNETEFEKDHEEEEEVVEETASVIDYETASSFSADTTSSSRTLSSAGDSQSRPLGGRGLRSHQMSSIVFGDDNPPDANFSPQKKRPQRRALGPVGGGSSSITFG